MAPGQLPDEGLGQMLCISAGDNAYSGGGEGLTLLLSWLLMQAGVDLGSVRADQENEKKRQGKSKKQALPKAQLRPKRRAPISQVLLVGGSTRMPAMRRFVLNMTGLEPATLVQPDEVDTSTKHDSLLCSACEALCHSHYGSLS